MIIYFSQMILHEMMLLIWIYALIYITINLQMCARKDNNVTIE